MKLPLVELVQTGNFTNGSFVFPNAWYSIQAQKPGGQVVGHVRYGVSPLNDRIYVDGLSVEREFWKSGYASSMLLAVVVQCSPAGNLMPLTPLHEVFASNGFWHKLRKGAIAGLVVTQDLRSGSEMDEEAKRWRRPT